MKKNLVLCAAGDQSLHKLWLQGENKHFDLMLIYLGVKTDRYRNDARYYLQASGMFKLENIAWALDKFYDIVVGYDAVFLPDDDIFMTSSDIHRLFEVFHR